MRIKWQMQNWKRSIAVVCAATMILGGSILPMETMAETEGYSLETEADDTVDGTTNETSDAADVTTDETTNDTEDVTVDETTDVSTCAITDETVDVAAEFSAVQGEETQKKEYSCSFKIHTHEQSCYDADQNVICGYADYVVHTHDENCYDQDGKLVCQLKEVKEHLHDDSCYKVVEIPEAASPENEETDSEETQQGHVHTEECYQTEQILICGQEETQGHTHTEDCYGEELVCGQEETQGHTHKESCYNADMELICGQEETPAHTHTEACYFYPLICGQEETQGHTHDASCYTTEKHLICGQEETEQTVTELSTEEAETVTRELVCTKPEVQLHTHVDSCYDQNGTLICGKLEVQKHQHTEACFTTVQSEAEETEAQDTEAEETDDQEKLDALCDAIVEAVQKDAELLTSLSVAVDDPDTLKELAEQFGVEEDDMTLLFAKMEEVNAAIIASMDDMDEEEMNALMEQMQEALTDPEVLEELAERFQTTPSLLLLVLYQTLGVETASTEDSNVYVGIRVGNVGPISGVSPEIALGVVSYEDYIAEDATETTRTENAQVAYCFNLYKKFPGNKLDGEFQVGYAYENVTRNDAYCLYQVGKDETGDYFKELATGENSSYTAAELKNKILNVALNGYPHNYSGLFYGQGGMTEEQFRLITQYAIWYYTDSFIPDLDKICYKYDDNGNFISYDRFTEEEKELYYALVNDKNSNLTTTAAYKEYSARIKAAYKAENEITDSSVLNQTFIHLYASLSDKNAYDGDSFEYQNLLVVGYLSDAINPYVPTPTPTPTPSTYSFTVNKTVIGGSDDDEFDFTFRLYLNGQVASTDYTFSLKNGGTYSLNLPSGYSGLTYEVIENSAEGYTASATSDQGDKGTKNTDGSYTITGAVNRDITVEFVNTKSGPTATPTPSPIPTPENYRVIVRKTVKDASGNSTGTDTTKFNFKIRFYKGSGDGVAYSNLEMSEADGETKYYTRSSANYTGYTFEIIETAADGYTTTGSSTREGYTAGQDADGNYKITGTIGGTDSNIYVDFVNTKEPDTYNLTLGKEVIVENTEIDTSQEFTFKVKLTDYNNKSESGDTYAALSGPFDVTYSKTDESAEDVPTTQSLPFTNGEQEITLKHGQTITISGLPAGYNFTVSEASDILTDYTPRIQLDGETVTDQDGNDVFSGFSYYNANEDHTLIFNNTRIETTHTLTLSKEVKTDKSEINTDEDFTFTIKLYDSKKAVLTQKFKATYGTLSGVTNAKAPETTETELDFSSGETTVTLKHGQTITIEGLPNIYGYTISETPSGYTPTVKVDGVQMKNSQGTETLNRFSYYSVSKDMTVAYTNKKIEYHLTLEKTVEGRFADKNKAFTFNIELKEGTAALTGKVKVTSSAEDGVEAPTYTELTFDKDGKASVSLKHGQKITLEGLPYNYVCKITEDSTVAAGYQIKSSFEDTQGTDTLSSGQSISVSGYEAAKISFVNTKSELVTTGLRLDVMPYIIGACIVVAFAAFLLAGRRRHK